MNVNNSLIEFSLELCLLHFEQGGKNRNGKRSRHGSLILLIRPVTRKQKPPTGYGSKENMVCGYEWS